MKSYQFIPNLNYFLIESSSQITYYLKMIYRFIKIITILISFFFLTGFLPFISLLGPGITAFTSGNVYKAGAQYMVNKSIKSTTGKNSLTYFKEKLEINDDKEKFNLELMQLVKKRIELTRKKLNLNNINQ